MYYLKPNVVAEPLVNQWYASFYLLSPAIAAMMFAFSRMKIMSSYVASPQMHELACIHPETKGGPFIDYPTRQVESVKALLELTKQNMAHHIQFAEDIRTLFELLEQHPDGMSLEPLYQALPDTLRGYVELYYDLANRPNFRLIEPFLYHSALNTAPYQNTLLSLTTEDFRPFCLSTPRLPSEESITLNHPFRDEIYDQLFSSREKPISEKNLKTLMQQAFKTEEVSQVEEDAFLNLFTTEKPVRRHQPLDKDSPYKITYYGHACVLVETQSCSILFDPILSYDYPSDIPRLTYTDLPDTIDYVVLTHTHQDHVLIEHLLQLRYKVRHFIVPANVIGALQDPSLKLMLEDLNFSSVTALTEFEKVDLPGGYLKALPFLGEHADLNIQSKLTYLLNIADVQILFAIDSNNLEHEVHLKMHELIGDVDILFIGMECEGAPLSWLYEPILLKPVTRNMDQSRRLDGSDFEKARKMVDTFKCKEVYIYAMGQEPWLNYIMGLHCSPDAIQILESNKLVDYCMDQKIKSERLFGSTVLAS